MIFGIIGPIIALSLIVVDIMLSPWYSWYTNALSDLGVHPYSYLFNGGLIIEAGANLLFVIGLRKLDLAGKGIAVILAVSGIALGLVGVFNEHHGLEHLTFALIYFILFPIAIILFSAGKRIRGHYSRSLGYGCSVVGLAFIIVGILQDFKLFKTGLGLGFYEMVEAVLLSIWVVYTGSYYLATKA